VKNVLLAVILAAVGQAAVAEWPNTMYWGRYTMPGQAGFHFIGPFSDPNTCARNRHRIPQGAIWYGCVPR